MVKIDGRKSHRDKNRDHISTNLKERENDGGSKAQGRKFQGMCSVSAPSTHFSDVMMGSMHSPEKETAMLNAMQPVIDKFSHQHSDERQCEEF